MRFPSFEQLAEVIRDSAQLRRDKRIDPDTQVFRDLNISGKDGADLLKAIGGHHGCEFASEFCDRLERMVLLELHKLPDIQEQTDRQANASVVDPALMNPAGISLSRQWFKVEPANSIVQRIGCIHEGNRGSSIRLKVTISCM
jgi:hypothetical protein